MTCCWAATTELGVTVDIMTMTIIIARVMTMAGGVAVVLLADVTTACHPEKMPAEVRVEMQMPSTVPAVRQRMAMARDSAINVALR